MHWYLIHTKPRQERCALQNLEQQGFECFFPTLKAEKLRRSAIRLVEEPLFPRYLFIRLDPSLQGKSWGPIRYTKGVNRLVAFGAAPARVDDALVDGIKAQAQAAAESAPQRLFAPGDRVSLSSGPFAGLQAVYQMADGDSRAMLLIELLSKPLLFSTPVAGLQKAG